MMYKYDEDMLSGFTPGNNIAYYISHINELPDDPGVYAIVLPYGKDPNFLRIGTGGFFKGKDPNVSVKELMDKWVKGASILYIGKAINLRKRLHQYFKFGQSANIGHWGGRYIWQLSKAQELLVYWKTTDDANPEEVETKLIQEFKANHDGKRPFANIKK